MEVCTGKKRVKNLVLKIETKSQSVFMLNSGNCFDHLLIVPDWFVASLQNTGPTLEAGFPQRAEPSTFTSTAGENKYE